MDQTSKEIGRHEADIDSLKIDVSQMKSDIGEIKDFIVTRKVERHLGALILAALATVGGALMSYLPHFLSNVFKLKGLN